MGESSSGSVASFGIDFADDYRARSRADQVLRSILVTSGLLEDLETGTATMSSGVAATLRSLRQTGPLGEMRGEAQSTLLGGILYEYSATGSGVRAAEARHWAIGRSPPRNGGAAASPIPSDPSLARLRLGLERVLNDNTLGSIGDSRDVASALSSTGASSSWRSPLQPEARPREGAGMSPASRLTGLSETEREFFRMVHHGQHADSSLLSSDMPEEDALGSSVASSSGSSRALDREHLGESGISELLVGLSGMTGSSSANATSEGAEESVTGFLRRLAAEDESLVRSWLAADDEGLAQSSRRVLQMGAVLAGARLSDTEIRGLPKVRFDQAEEQMCSICLEAFKPGEFLTELPCSHFFHVACVARWFRNSQQCPLCRSQCRAGAASEAPEEPL
mmetsp:Transcript_91757/g.285487  ORF Transcript_91757/g.285487 Transcript_91757/m.285487 type:complete len:394 (+) Transcript_91757:1-1182(+)